MTPDLPPPGWYPNPRGEMQWWDGSSWTAQAVPPRQRIGFAVTAFALGIVAFLVGWVPVVGLVLGGGAVVFALVALKARQPKPMALTGLITGGLAFFTSLVTTVIFTLSISTGSTSARPSTDDAQQLPTAGCDAAVSEASAAMNEHYATHPLFGPEYDALYADGELTDQESETLNAWVADEEEQFTAAIDPIFDACTGVEDLYAAAFEHRNVADWGLLESEYLTHDENKSIFVISYCGSVTDRPACHDFDPEDWE